MFRYFPLESSQMSTIDDTQTIPIFNGNVKSIRCYHPTAEACSVEDQPGGPDRLGKGGAATGRHRESARPASVAYTLSDALNLLS
ncbi:hypothetical protein EVAR_65807_1 [Eumeta japonica]|uniref:Uncharacterized protein n=1 Tax=Eumeta variegata TaxID=151549 RepID=A0A4C1ZRM2_EUMVA|nr:hypothetical protein EVAR_65807_1 [Eumeta japonica]